MVEAIEAVFAKKAQKTLHLRHMTLVLPLQPGILNFFLILELELCREVVAPIIADFRWKWNHLSTNFSLSCLTILILGIKFLRHFRSDQCFSNVCFEFQQIHPISCWMIYRFTLPSELHPGVAACHVNEMGENTQCPLFCSCCDAAVGQVSVHQVYATHIFIVEPNKSWLFYL